jgi:hypothetical protein
MTFEFSSDGPVSIGCTWPNISNEDKATRQETDTEFLLSCGIYPAEE